MFAISFRLRIKSIHNTRIIKRCQDVNIKTSNSECCIFYAFQVYEPFIDGVFDKPNWTIHTYCAFVHCQKPWIIPGMFLLFQAVPAGTVSELIALPTRKAVPVQEKCLSWVKMYVFSETFAGIARAQRRFKCRLWSGDKCGDALVNYSIHDSSMIPLNNEKEERLPGFLGVVWSHHLGFPCQRG